MKKFGLALFGALFFCTAAQAAMHYGDFGAGIVLGSITGPTINYFTGPNTSIDAGLGFDSDFDAYADYVWHSWTIFPRPEKGKFGGYLGLGPRFQANSGRDNKDEFGVRTIAGMDYWVEGVPLQIFLELGPWFVFTPHTDTNFDAGLGVRYYFGKK